VVLFTGAGSVGLLVGSPGVRPFPPGEPQRIQIRIEIHVDTVKSAQSLVGVGGAWRAVGVIADKKTTGRPEGRPAG
jgi:hypothetical protein